MLSCIGLEGGGDLWEEKALEDFHGGAQERYRSVGGTVLQWLARFLDRDDNGVFPYSRDVGLID